MSYKNNVLDIGSKRHCLYNSKTRCDGQKLISDSYSTPKNTYIRKINIKTFFKMVICLSISKKYDKKKGRENSIFYYKIESSS